MLGLTMWLCLRCGSLRSFTWLPQSHVHRHVALTPLDCFAFTVLQMLCSCPVASHFIPAAYRSACTDGGRGQLKKSNACSLMSSLFTSIQQLLSCLVHSWHTAKQRLMNHGHIALIWCSVGFMRAATATIIHQPCDLCDVVV